MSVSNQINNLIDASIFILHVHMPIHAVFAPSPSIFLSWLFSYPLIRAAMLMDLIICSDTYVSSVNALISESM